MLTRSRARLQDSLIANDSEDTELKDASILASPKTPISTKMSKYDALWRYLQTSGQTQLTLTLDEIAALAGTALDHSFLT